MQHIKTARPFMPPPHNHVRSDFGGAGLNPYYIMVWVLYVLISSVYIFPKGMPQPADLLLVAGIGPALMAFFLNYKGSVKPVYLYGILFAAYAFVINWANFVFFPDKRLALSSLYYIYNFLTFGFVVYLFKKDSRTVGKLTYYAIVLATFMQLAWVIFFPDQGVKRMTGGFLNPNQLAYWSLLTAGMLFFLKRYEKINLFDVILFGTLGYIQTFALSKAGTISFAILFVYMVFTPHVTRHAKYLIFILIMAASMYSVFNPGKVLEVIQGTNTYERVEARLLTIGQENDESLEGRGYNRIWENPEYLLFGAGEGAFQRFRTWASSNELHSGLATILFSYGVLGSLFFGLFLFRIFWPQPIVMWMIFGFILMFSVTHQAFRFTHFWAMLGIAYGSYKYGVPLFKKPKKRLRPG